MKHRCWLATTLLIILGGWATAALAQSPTERDFRPRVLMKPIRPIVNAPFLAAANVADQVADNELVLGVVVKGEARAYPINMLTGPRREIINDQLGGNAIAATW